ncbi:MAG TPA: HAD-IIIC family phosphatase [Candidatus Sulfopaludibacter sp.]|nr:HAD-IIIC family phosphatase [Candidatus Sulfopaludibacter sp.]
MTLTEALKTVQQADASAPPFRATLACGFTALHLQTFLAAHLQQRLRGRRATISTGLYGDLTGTLEAAPSRGDAHAVAIALEWFDLDPRLGHRGEGKWGPSAVADVVSVTQTALGRMVRAVEAIPAEIPVAVSLPTLRTAPVFHTPGSRFAAAELELERALMEYATRIARRPGCAVVNRERFAVDSPPGDRYDLRSDLMHGLPYTLPHTDALAAALAGLLAPAAPKKGLISDLDDTLWFGIVGEIGADQVRWDLASQHQLHGLYQQLLGSLAEEGVLIGIASKNDPAVVKRAFERGDLRVPPSRMFPVEVSWKAKSGAVERILRAWNIGADSVVFVDDSPMELAEVAAAHPGIECLLFPKDDYTAGQAMLRRLRDLFGKPRVSEEDAIRLESIRQGAAFQEAGAEGEASELFLEQAEATVTLEWNGENDPRVLELVNKTNQFNLNGVRFTAAEWKERLSRPGAWLATVSYLDKFGPLGKIAVLQGHRDGEGCLCVDTWVMSCRAFSRRIEHQCVKVLFDRFQATQVAFTFQPTPKNGPLQDFFTAITGTRPDSEVTLARARFRASCPPLYHRVNDGATALSNSAE